MWWDKVRKVWMINPKKLAEEDNERKELRLVDTELYQDGPVVTIRETEKDVQDDNHDTVVQPVAAANDTTETKLTKPTKRRVFGKTVDF